MLVRRTLRRLQPAVAADHADRVCIRRREWRRARRLRVQGGRGWIAHQNAGIARLGHAVIGVQTAVGLHRRRSAKVSGLGHAGVFSAERADQLHWGRRPLDAAASGRRWRPAQPLSDRPVCSASAIEMMAAHHCSQRRWGAVLTSLLGRGATGAAIAVADHSWIRAEADNFVWPHGRVQGNHGRNQIGGLVSRRRRRQELFW